MPISLTLSSVELLALQAVAAAEQRAKKLRDTVYADICAAHQLAPGGTLNIPDVTQNKADYSEPQCLGN